MDEIEDRKASGPTPRSGQEENAEPLPPFKVTPKATGFQPGIDPLKLNQLVDQLAVEDFLEKHGADLGEPPSE